MKNLKLLFILVFILIATGCRSQGVLQQINEYSDSIIATWVEEEDNSYKFTFLENGICEEYVDDELLSTFNFTVQNNCKNYSATNTFYLKLVNTSDDQEIICFEILNITENYLSLMIIDKAERLLFVKE